MNKKTSIFIIIFVVLLALVITLILISQKQEQVNNNEVAQNNNQPEVGSEVSIEASEEELAELPEEQRIPVSEENEFIIDGDSFSPKTIYGEVGKRVLLTVESKDGLRHIIASEDPQIKDIFLVLINEEEEPKSVAFVAPEAGQYSFYVDDTSNVGTLVIR